MTVEERLAWLEKWAKDCRDKVLVPVAYGNSKQGVDAEGLGYALADYHRRVARDKAFDSLPDDYETG